jgi:hypothetical protein
MARLPKKPPHSAKQRHGATDSAKKPQKEIAGAKKRQPASIAPSSLLQPAKRIRTVPRGGLCRLEQLFGGQNQ